jgi:histidinol-phosphate aminotransferase
MNKNLPSHIANLPAYTPIEPFEVLSARVGRAPDEIIKLDANENPYGMSPRARAALANLPYGHIYPDPESRALRTALASFSGAPFENLLAGAGADELIDLILRVLVEPGDTILNCPPTFGMYAFDAGLNHIRVVDVTRNPDFTLDVEAITAAVHQHQPKLIFLTSPNNPDGSLIPLPVLQKILGLPIMVVLDEAYIDFSDTPSLISAVAERENLIVLRTFSKLAGLAGLRVGYGGFPSWLMPTLWKAKQPYNVNVAGCAAAIASLEDADHLRSNVARLRAERERLHDGLSRIACLSPYPSSSNFILCRVTSRQAQQTPTQTAARIKAVLAEKYGIFIRYFDKPGLRDCIRISVGKPEHTDALLKAMSELIHSPHGYKPNKGEPCEQPR